MAQQVMMKCPVKGVAVPLGIEINYRSEWDAMSVTDKKLEKCPACGGTHDVVKREAFLAATTLGAAPATTSADRGIGRGING